MKASKAIEMKLELIEKICGLVLNSKGPRNLSAGFVAMVKRIKRQHILKSVTLKMY